MISLHDLSFALLTQRGSTSYLNLANENARHKPGTYIGTAEDTNLELLDNVSSWLIANQDSNWLLQLKECKNTSFIQRYHY